MDSASEMCAESDVIYTQTPGSTTCLEKSWLKPHATIICSGPLIQRGNELYFNAVAATPSKEPRHFL